MPSKDISYFLPHASNSYGPILYAIAGSSSMHLTGGYGAVTANTIYATPRPSGQGFSTDQIIIDANPIHGDFDLRVAIYQGGNAFPNQVPGVVYPTLLLGESDPVTVTGGGAQVIDLTSTVIVAADTIVWFVVNQAAPSGAYRPIRNECDYNMLGVDCPNGNHQGIGAIAAGLTVARTFGAFPSTFPLGGIVVEYLTTPIFGFRVL